MKIKQVKDTYVRAENITVYNHIPDFDKIKKELGVLKLIADKSTLSNGTEEIHLFAYLDEKRYTVDYVKILKMIAKTSKTSLIINFDDDEEMTVTIYDDYME